MAGQDDPKNRLTVSRFPKGVERDARAIWADVDFRRKLAAMLSLLLDDDVPLEVRDRMEDWALLLGSYFERCERDGESPEYSGIFSRFLEAVGVDFLEKFAREKSRSSG